MTFATKFLEIANNPNNYKSAPGDLLRTAIAEYADKRGITEQAAIAVLATMPSYGEHGAIGGVNIYANRRGQVLRTEWATYDGNESTWCALETVVDCIDGGAPSWFYPKWFTVEGDDNTQAFADACYDMNTIAELQAALAGTDGGWNRTSDCEQWDLPEAQWRKAIQIALAELLEEQEKLDDDADAD